MKMRFQWLIVLVAFFSAFAVDGGTFTRFTGFGSTENAEDQYGAALSSAMAVSVTQRTDDGREIGRTRTFTVSQPSIEGMEVVFREKLRLVAQDILTNAAVNKDKPFRIWAYTLQAFAGARNTQNLYHISEYSLVNDGDGLYRIPNFEDKCLSLRPWMLYPFPGLVWARIEVYEKGEFGSRKLIYSLDSRFGPQEDGTYNRIFLTEGFVQIATDLAVLGTNSTTEIKISTCVRNGATYTFQVFDPMGYEIPGGTPVTLVTSVREDGDIRLDINGGDTGRILQLQTAPTVAGPWVNVGEELMVGVEGYPPLYFLKALASATGELRVYRIATVAKAPFASFRQREFRLD